MLIEIIRPIKNPRIIELRLLARDSQIVIFIISLLVIPIARNTPSSHMLSRIFAEIETINQKNPRIKQTSEIAMLKKSSIPILASISSMKVIASKAINESSFAKLRRLFFNMLLCFIVVSGFNLIKSAYFGILSLLFGKSIRFQANAYLALGYRQKASSSIALN